MGKKKILIVEDEILVAICLRNILERMGYEVSNPVTSGEEAVLEIDKDRPDIIIMDISLKGRMTGIETAKIIHSKICIPIIFISGYRKEDIQAEITPQITYLSKPFNPEILKPTIESLLLQDCSTSQQKQ
jgi:two-component SAPR family response regulator